MLPPLRPPRARLVLHARGEAHPQQNEIARAHPQGDPRAPRLPQRCRPRIPQPRPHLRHAVGRREPAHPPRQPDRLRPDRRALRARRALHRPAPARQRPPARHPQAPARPRQHRARGRARRGRDPHRRLRHRHGPRRRRPRRRVVAQGTPAESWPTRTRSPAEYLTGRRASPCPKRRKGPARSSRSRAPAATTSRTSRPRSRSAPSPASPASPAAASPRFTIDTLYKPAPRAS
jgi:hypothetical protein